MSAYPSNRDRKMEPKRAKGWCGGCDRAVVDEGKRCPACGGRQRGKRRLKKAPAP